MKRIYALLLVCVLSFLVLAACGGSDSNSSNADSFERSSRADDSDTRDTRDDERDTRADERSTSKDDRNTGDDNRNNRDDSSSSGNMGQYPDYLDFTSVSRSAEFLFSSETRDIELDGMEEYYDMVYFYSLPHDNWVDDTNAYDDVLDSNGFTVQDTGFEDSLYTALYYSSRLDLSVAYTYLFDEDGLVVMIGKGDAFTRIESALGGGGAAQKPGGGGNAGDFLDFLNVSRNAELLYFGGTDEFDFDGMEYEFEAASVYSLPERNWLDDTDAYDDVLFANGFSLEGYKYENGEYYYWFYNENLNISVFYAYAEYDELLIIMYGPGYVDVSYYL